MKVHVFMGKTISQVSVAEYPLLDLSCPSCPALVDRNQLLIQPDESVALFTLRLCKKTLLFATFVSFIFN